MGLPVITLKVIKGTASDFLWNGEQKMIQHDGSFLFVLLHFLLVNHFVCLQLTVHIWKV